MVTGARHVIDRADREQLDPANNLTTDQLLARQAEVEAEAGPSTSTSAPTAGSADLPPVQQIAPLPPTASITDLRAKLHDRLEKFKRDRGEPETRDELEEERRRKRGEMRDRRRNELKERKRKERQEPTAKGAKVSHYSTHNPPHEFVLTPLDPIDRSATIQIEARHRWNQLPSSLPPFHLEAEQSTTQSTLQPVASARTSRKTQLETRFSTRGETKRD